MRRRVRPNLRGVVLSLAMLAGALAFASILYDQGIRPPWLERFQLKWMISSDLLAERAYQQFLSGKRAEGLALFELGLRRDPASPYRWCDYGEALLWAGDKAPARRAIERGLDLAPYVAAIRMRAVNFGYRIEDPAWTLEQGWTLLAMTPDYDDAVFHAWDSMELTAGDALRHGMPSRRAVRSYLRHLMGRAPSAGAHEVWGWLLPRSFIDDNLADQYAGFLLRWHEYDAARAAWTAYAGRRDSGYPDRNVVFNGSFEREPAGTTFDWCISSVPGVRAERDSSVAAEGRYSLRLTFDGTLNVAFGHAWQRVAVDARNWRFSARMRTAGITTNEGIRFRIFDPEEPARLDISTEGLTGTCDWTDISARFVVRPGTHLVEIRIVRNPSWMLDNKIHGTAWIDSVMLRS